MADYKESHDEQVTQMLAHKVELLQKRPYRHWNSNFGMIASLGGVIIVPLLICLWGGTYLDEAYPQHFSWRLSGIFLGFLWGLCNAYFWIKIEDRKIAQLDDVRSDKKHD